MTGPMVPRARPRRRSHRSNPAHAALLLVLLATGGALAASAPAVRAERAMVVSPEAQATRVGVQVLADGGNAVDAAVAVAFALAVTFPTAGNLGGGGFLLYRQPDGRVFALDFRETAPRKLEAGDFLDEQGRAVSDRSLRGGLAVGVPGSVAGLAEAHARWGTRPWAALVAPAVRLARRGSEVSPWMARAYAEEAELLRADPEARRIYTDDGAPLRSGARLVQRDLAGTLRCVASRGADCFYRGAVAEALERTVREAGGVLDREDLARYRPVLREPLTGSYRGHRVHTFPAPSSGGIVLLEILGMLERFDLADSGFGSSATVHLVAEAARRAYADRARWLGDPDFVDVPVAGLLDPAYLAQRAGTIRLDRATPSSEILAGEPRGGGPPHDTLHLSVADPHGGAVALTTTLNTSFGTGIVARGTGVLLNNEIDDFSLAPGTPNTYGLVGGEANAVAGGKRPLSSMCPTIVERPGGGPRPLLVLGSPGGSTIITSVLQVLLDVVDHGLPLQEAVDAARFHHQWQPDRIRHEVRAWPADVADALRARGHVLAPAPGTIGNVNAIGTDADGAWLGAADPRRGGSAAGF